MVIAAQSFEIRLRPVAFAWEGSVNGEKIMHTAKKEFLSKNFGELLMRKTHAKKILQHLISRNENEEDDKDNLSSCKI